jgi:catechol-2,3-dioxygenase
VALLVRNLDGMVAFYVDTIGLQVSDIGTAAGRPGSPRIALLSWDPPTLHHQIALLEVRSDSSAPRNVHHVAFEVDTLDELRTIWNRVRRDVRAGSLDPAADGPVTAFIGDQWSIRFTDPEGNGIEIYAPTPWDTRAAATPYSTSGTAFEPFNLDADDDTLVGWGAQQLEVMGMDHWPRGTRLWPSDVEHRTND